MSAPLFDHRDTGRSEAVWSDAPGWALTCPVALTAGHGVRAVVVVAAHPDDETLGAGGAMASAYAAGIPVVVLLATDGEASHPASPTHSPERLVRLRVAEVRRALDRVVPGAELRRLQLPDGELARHEDELNTALEQLVDPLGAGCVLLAPWRADGHPDHEAAGRVAARCAERTGAVLGEYPVWAWHWAEDTDLPWEQVRTLSLDGTARLAKRAALGEHHTQVEPLSDLPGDEVLLTPAMLAHFERPFETFVDSGGTWRESVFERLHRVAADPWSVTSSRFEADKRARTLAVLPSGRFRRAFEPGCSVGELTAALADRCDEVLAVDVSATAVRAARERTRAMPTVRIEQRMVPQWWPTGRFDLVVLSEICYFLQPDALRHLLIRVRESLCEGGWVVVCDWRHPIDGWALDAAAVHQAARDLLDLPVAISDADDDVLLEVFGPAADPAGSGR